MSTAHSDIGPELRKLAQRVLDQLDPAIRLMAARTVGDGAGTGACQQVWCPVCALAAVVTGDEHPLLTVIAEHSVTLLAVIRAIVDPVGQPTPPPPDGPSTGPAPDQAIDEPAPPSRYQPIAVTVEE